MKASWKYLAVFAPLMALTPLVVAAQSNLPVVAVLPWNNDAFGPGAKDFDGIGKGIMDIMITELASSGKVRVVERDRVQQILDEQKLSTDGHVSSETAVRVGKMLGACYSIYGGFIRDAAKGTNAITAHTTNNETSQIENSQKLNPSGDDVMKLIADMSAKFLADLKLGGCPGMSGAKSASATPAQQGSAPEPSMTKPVEQKTVAEQKPVTQAKSTTAEPKPVAQKPAATTAEKYSKAFTKQDLETMHSKPVDARSMLLYSRAIDAMDHKDNAKAADLLKQVLAKNPTFTRAKDLQASLPKSGD